MSRRVDIALKLDQAGPDRPYRAPVLLGELVVEHGRRRGGVGGEPLLAQRGFKIRCPRRMGPRGPAWPGRQNPPGCCNGLWQQWPRFAGSSGIGDLSLEPLNTSDVTAGDSPQLALKHLDARVLLLTKPLRLPAVEHVRGELTDPFGLVLGELPREPGGSECVVSAVVRLVEPDTVDLAEVGQRALLFTLRRMQVAVDADRIDDRAGQVQPPTVVAT